jgi:hypothetical protein
VLAAGQPKHVVKTDDLLRRLRRPIPSVSEIEQCEIVFFAMLRSHADDVTGKVAIHKGCPPRAAA